MTDRELLEKAAKAADLPISFGLSGRPYIHQTAWNPLTDDGDALRLAGELPEPISIDINKGFTIVSGWSFDIHELHSDDPQAATRRAIVRAAAAIGETL